MTQLSTASPFWSGFRAASPFVLVVAPFGLLFGVIAKDAGLNLIEVMTMSMLVVAGAAQFTAITLMIEQAPTFIVLLTALAVNLRMAMYSAALTPHLGAAPMWQRATMAYFMVDQSFAVAYLRYEAEPDRSLSWKIRFYIGSLTPLFPLWVGFSLVGALMGQAIPPEYSLDFAIPICFIALTAPAMRSLPHFIAACVSIIAALAFVWVPYSLGLIVAAILAMISGAQVELWQTRRKS